MAERYNERDYDRNDERDTERYERRDDYGSERVERTGRSAYGFNAGRNQGRSYEEDYDRDYGRTRSPRAFDYERESTYGNDYRSDYDRDYGRRPARFDERESGYGRDYERGDARALERYGPRGGRDYTDERDYERGPRDYEYERGDWSLRRQRGGSVEARGREGRAPQPARERNWWDRVSDEVASWFGDEEAERRRLRDEGQRAMSHRGRGPRGYQRADERIRDDINDRLTDHPYIDATDVEVQVQSGEVTLTGAVETRQAKRLAEDIAESISGVKNVENRLRITRGAFETIEPQPTPALTTGPTPAPTEEMTKVSTSSAAAGASGTGRTKTQ
ncbi:MAG: BON domain-containing protein [Pyrinomonadaceae bacterium]